MYTRHGPQGDVITLGPGELFASKDLQVLQTLLGSCVAACLYDPVARVYGMNHFLLAFKKSETQQTMLNSKEGYYGVHAMELLINALLKKGASRQRLKAKIFGGGNVLRQYTQGRTNFFDIGRYNIEFVTEFLHKERIPIINSSVGDHYGRIIYFDPSDFSVYQKRISHNQEQILARDELLYLESKHDNGSQVHIW